MYLAEHASPLLKPWPSSTPAHCASHCSHKQPLHAGRLCHTLEGHSLEIVCLAFSPQSSHAVTASMDKTAILWDAITGAHVAELSEHSGELVSVAFDAQGSLLLTGSFDHTARLWDVRTGRCVHRFEGHTAEVCLPRYC